MNYYLICFILSAILTVVHLYKWKNQYGIHFALMYIFATIANFGYWQIYDATQLNQAVLANKIAYVGGCFSTLALMMCIFSVCKVKINKKLSALLYLFTCGVYGTSLTVGYNDIFYKSVSLELIDGRYTLIKEYSFFHTVFYIMLVLYIAISLVVLVIGFRKKKEVSFKSVGLMFVVMLINFLSFFLGRALFDIELITASYVITEIIILIVTKRLLLYNVDEMVTLSMIDNNEVGAAMFNSDYIFLGCNDIARKYYPQLELLAVDKKVNVENDLLKQLVSWMDEIKAKSSFELVYQCDEKYYKVLGKNLYDKNKKRGYSFIFVDFTGEKQREEELIRVRTKAKSDVLAQMSHEIRTPINAILGMNEMILRSTNELETGQYAKDVRNATNNLLEIVNEILDFSKIEAGKLELACVEYNLASLINYVVNMFTIRARDKGLEFIADIDESLPAGLYGDDVKIRQVLANILSNAVKYTPNGNIRLELKGDVQEDFLILHFRVKDTGIGIKPEDREKLFSEFERIEDKQNRGIEGTGLGMSITIRFLQMMDSELSVDSVYGEGSEFYFDLKQKIVNTETIGVYQQQQNLNQVIEGEYKTFTAPDARILVVDDNKMNLKVFCSLLEITGINIDTAESGEACLELVKKNTYDMIFLDHMMPEMDGVETLHRLKNTEESKCQKVPVIALTANAISGAKEFYLSEGFDAFMSKPFNPKTLESMILTYLPKEYVVYDSQISESEANIDTELPEIEGIDWEYGLSHFNDKESMLEMMEDFYYSITNEADKLNKFYDKLVESSGEDEFKQYRVQVHSMKSMANLIGAVKLGTKAKELEDAANAHDSGFILKTNNNFIEEWRDFKMCLRRLFRKRPKEKEFSFTVMKESLDELKVAFETMDLDKMDEKIKNLSEYEYPDYLVDDFEKLKACVVDLDSENGIATIEIIKQKTNVAVGLVMRDLGVKL